MKKKIFCFIACLILLSSLIFPVSAAETGLDDEKFLENVDATIQEKDNGQYELCINLKNTSKYVLEYIDVNFTYFNKDEIVFSDKALGSAVEITESDGGIYLEPQRTSPKLSLEQINPGDTVQLLFEISSCSNTKSLIDLHIGFYYLPDIIQKQGHTVYERDGLIAVQQEFKDILNPQTGASDSGDVILNFLSQTGFYAIAQNWKAIVMIFISFALIYLAIVKKFEPLLLLPIAFGMLLTNLPGAEMYHAELYNGGHVNWSNFADNAGLIDYLYLGVKLGIYPCLIFLGIGAMTDFGPLIANPKSLLLGAAAQLGIFVTYFAAADLLGFQANEAASIGIIGGADGPTAIFVSSKLAPQLLGPIAVAAYSYMALVPFIQPPIMKVLTTKKERSIIMKEMRSVSKTEKIIFPIIVTVFVALFVPSAAPLVGCLMLGNLMRESGVVDRISKAAQNELMNIVTVFLGISVGATATAQAFLNFKTLGILLLGIIAFSFGTAGGVLFAKLMNLFSKNKINPLIGSAGVSAVPMAARVSQSVGQKENPSNFLLMHAMGPNVAGVIGSAIAAGVLIALFG